MKKTSFILTSILVFFLAVLYFMPTTFSLESGKKITEKLSQEIVLALNNAGITD